MLKKYTIDLILLAIPAASKEERKKILNILEIYKIRVKTVPQISEILSGKSTINKFQDVEAKDLLIRDQVLPFSNLLKSNIENNTVLITGAGGSIGSELSRQIINLKPRTIILVEMSEFALYSINTELEDAIYKENSDIKIVPLLASIKDISRMEVIFSKYNDQNKIKDFIKKVDVVTFEFENIPVDILKSIDKEKKVYPKPDINKIIQNRKLEKTFVNDLGIKTTEWGFIKSAEDILKNEKLLPGILKTNTLGYDGHGQFVLNSLDDIKKDWCFTADYILEKKVDLKKEISVILTRFQNGAISIYAPIENVHENQILKRSKIPAEINDKITSEALQSAQKIAEHLDYVGTMAVEYFINQNNELLVNEIAPRVHNSGHLTINAFNVSQFEGHVRAVCDLKIIAPDKISNSAEMINILGKEIEEYRSKTFDKNEFFFDYGKKEIKDKRKMGHLTILKK